MWKKCIPYLFIFFLFCMEGFAQKLPRTSPIEEIIQEVGLTEIKIRYGRPNVKGRKGKIWGKLVEYNKVWRTGANEATVIEFSDSVKINGTMIPAGRYALFSIPQKKEAWVFILNKNADSWGTTQYQSEKDVLRFKAYPEKSEFTESFTFEFANVTSDKASILLRWENLKIDFKVDVFTLPRAVANIRKALGENPTWETYSKSAHYFKEQKISLNEAKDWINKAIALNPEHYYPYWIKADIFAIEKNYKAAIEAAQKALELSQKNEEENIALYRKALEQSIDVWSEYLK